MNEVSFDEHLAALIKRAVRTWEESRLSEGDLAEYIDKTLTHDFLPGILRELAAESVRQALARHGLLNKAVERWALEFVSDEEVPPRVKNMFVEALRAADMGNLVDKVADGQIAAYRMWIAGLGMAEIAEKLGVKEQAAKRLVNRAKNRVQFLRDQLAAYG